MDIYLDDQKLWKVPGQRKAMVLMMQAPEQRQYSIYLMLRLSGKFTYEPREPPSPSLPLVKVI